MAKILSNDVLDAALDYISTNCVRLQLRKASSGVLLDTPSGSENAITLDSGNYGSNASGSSDGRKLQCLSSAASDMKALNVEAAGAIKYVCLMAVSVIHVQAELSPAVSVGASDQVNMGTFTVTLRDPT